MRGLLRGISGETPLNIPSSPSQYVVVNLNSPNATLTPFAGETAELTSDVPAGGPGGMVGKLIKTNGAQTWAGTTMSTEPNYSIPRIPFSNTNTIITVQLYVPNVGEPILLKAENALNGSIYVQTTATSTTTGWQTLSFDFANQSPSLDINQIYNKISIFPNFGFTGNNATYYVGPSIFIGASQPSS
jgi:hypothetical protein